MPLLTELENYPVEYNRYRHAAPDGASPVAEAGGVPKAAQKMPHSRAGAWSIWTSDFSFLSGFSLRPPDFSRLSSARRKSRSTGFHHLFLFLLLVSSSVCFGQRAKDARPAPLDPVQAEQEAHALVAEMLASRPDQNSTNTGQVRITDAADKERLIPVRFEITITPTNWINVYETMPSSGGRGGTKLTIIHSGDKPNRYELLDPATAGSTNAVAKVLTPDQLMVPFAGSDFWIADLGLEFLHWPKQRLLERNVIKHHKACRILQSINPSPVQGGYARVVSWIMIERPHGITHADAYDAQRNVLKHFDPKNLEKIEGEYQLEEMEIRNVKTDSQTVIKFNLAHQ